MTFSDEARERLVQTVSAEMRQGKTILRERILLLRYQADQLQALYDALPERLTPDQSAGLRVLIETKG